MTIKARLQKLERSGPAALTALDDLLASVAARGLRIHQRPAGPAEAARADPDEVTAALDALRRAPCLRTPAREAQP